MRKRKTIGSMTKSRGSWNGVKPVTKVEKDKTKYTRKSKHKGRKFE
jgi:hypothetical protein